MKVQQSRFKGAYVINCYSCCTYVNNKPSLWKLGLHNELVFIWLSLIKMRVVLERKIVSIETIMHNSGYQILVVNCLQSFIFPLWAGLDPKFSDGSI